MAEVKSNRFTKYFPLLLDALRSAHPAPMRPAEARAWIRSKLDVPAEDLTRRIKNGKQSIFENDVHWARLYLVKANLMSKSKRGQWTLTQEGLDKHLSPDETWALYVRIRDANRPANVVDEEESPAPTDDEEAEDSVGSWFVGVYADEQLPRFLAQGIWENGYGDQFSSQIRGMKPGDQIALKATFTKRNGVPFDVGGKSVSAMRIKATGTILENLGGRKDS